MFATAAELLTPERSWLRVWRGVRKVSHGSV